MGLRFLETSALVKLYVRERGTDAMLELAGRHGGHTLAILSLAIVEFASAITRRARAGDVDASIAERVIDQIGNHVSARFLVQGVTDRVVDLACGLVRRHGLRAYDAVQLAGFLALRESQSQFAPSDQWFVCSDAALLDAAREEGAIVFDPSKVA